MARSLLVEFHDGTTSAIHHVEQIDEADAYNVLSLCPLRLAIAPAPASLKKLKKSLLIRPKESI